MSRHCLLGEDIALPAALKVIEDFEIEFSHDVVGSCLNAVPDHRVSLVESSIFLRGKRFETLRLPDGRSNASWVVSHCVEELEVEVIEKSARVQQQKRQSFTHSGCGDP